ncbi:MAG: hypothetical protein R3B09_23380 [Nannocystaceae bacterium]
MPDPPMIGAALRGFDRWWRAPAPAERLAALRLLIGGFAAVYMLVRLPHLIGIGDLDPAGFRPIGVTSLLAATLDPAIVAAITVATALLGLAFVAGWRFAITGPLFAAGLLWVTTYRNSWGMVFHTENLMVIHVLVLGLARSADVWSLDARRRGPLRIDDPAYGWPIKLAATLTVITYVLAAEAKMRVSGGTWVVSDTLRNYIAYDNLRKAELGDSYSALGAALTAHAWVFPPLAGLSMGVELLAPVALVGRRIAAVWALLAWGFHVGVLSLMWIFFPYPLLGLAYAPFFPVERLPGLRRLAGRLFGT